MFQKRALAWSLWLAFSRGVLQACEILFIVDGSPGSVAENGASQGPERHAKSGPSAMGVVLLAAIGIPRGKADLRVERVVGPARLPASAPASSFWRWVLAGTAVYPDEAET